MITPVPGKPNLLLGAYDLATLGYRAEEFFVSGDRDGVPVDLWQADYTTRIVVLTPSTARTAAFNGTVLVEWLNVSGGIDAPAVWFMAHREIARAGYAYVAVSAQRVGVEGGDSLVGARHVTESPGSRNAIRRSVIPGTRSPTTSTPRSVGWSGTARSPGSSR